MSGMLDRFIHGRTDLVLDLLERLPATTSHEGATLVDWCARYGDVAALRVLLLRGADLTPLGENLGLGQAAFFGHWRLCEFLLEQGADPRHADRRTGETALHLAVSTPNRPAFDLVVQVLLAAGADPDAPTRPDIVTEAFMRDARTRGETPLHRAGAFGSEAVIRRLLDAGASREAQDVHGATPLAWASWHRRPDAVLRLLCYGVFGLDPDRDSTFDHGRGWGFLELDLLGAPRPG